MTTEAEGRVMEPQLKECQQLPEAGRGEEWIHLCSLQREHGLVDTSDFLSFRTMKV